MPPGYGAARARERSRALDALVAHEVDQHAGNARVVKSALVAGFYPQVGWPGCSCCGRGGLGLASWGPRPVLGLEERPLPQPAPACLLGPAGWSSVAPSAPSHTHACIRLPPPQLLRIDHPPAKYQKVLGGTMEIEAEPHKLKFFDRHKGGWAGGWEGGSAGGRQ